MKRLLSVLLAAVLLLGACPADALAAPPPISGHCGSEGDGTNLSWSLENNILTISGTGAMENYPEWEGYGPNVTKVIVTEGVTSLGIRAFDQFYDMEEISLPESLVTVGNHAFSDCVRLRSVRIPAQVKNASFVFYNCFQLESIEVAPDSQDFCSQDGILFSSDLSSIIRYPCRKTEESYWLPRGTVASSHSAFLGNNHLRSIGIPRDYSSSEIRETFSWPGLTDIYYEGTEEEAQELFQDLVYAKIHCNQPYGSPIPSTSQPSMSANEGGNRYIYNWSDTVASHLISNPDGSLTRVEQIENGIFAEDYDRDLHITSHRLVAELSQELPLYGGFFSGSDYNFLVFGDRNFSESDQREVIRVVRYSKDWKRLDDTRIFGANTYEPFRAGSLRMAQSGDYLYIHTSHAMYHADDGRNHQANVILNIHIPTMELRDHFWNVLNPSWGYVSHSFNQFIAIDGDRVLTVNHGDAYPRAIVLMEYPGKAGQDHLTGRCANAHFLNIPGALGLNFTGADLGAFEISDSSYIAAISTVNQERMGTGYSTQKNILISVLPRGPVANISSPAKHVYLTDYADTDQALCNVSAPHLVSISSDRLMVLWSETAADDRQSESLCWQIIDGDGDPVSPLYRDDKARLSDCRPVIHDGSLIWYSTDFTTPIFYRISLAAPETVQAVPSYTPPHYHRAGIWTTVREATCTEDGLKTSACVDCGARMEQIIPATGHNLSSWRSDEHSHWHECYTCGEKTDVSDHTWGEWEIVRKPTCTSTGCRSTTCTVCGCYHAESIPMTEHQWADVWCHNDSAHWQECSVCGTSRNHDFHSWGETEVIEAPTCTEAGIGSVACTVCGRERSISLPPSGHKRSSEFGHDENSHWYTCTVCGEKLDVEAHRWSGWTVVTEPTEKSAGLETRSCPVCHLSQSRSIPELNHQHSYTETIVAPTCTQKGYTLHTCSCGDSYKDSYVDPLGHHYENGVCTRCGEREPIISKDVTDVFTDVSNNWAHEGIQYCYDHKLMSGTSDTTFSPNGAMTRGMFAMVLWNQAGKPEPQEKAPFTDFTKNYYKKAITWAFENNVVNGVTPTLFAPDKAITREQVAAILYRYAKNVMKLDVSASNDISLFPDYSNVSNFAKVPLSWANAVGIITGSKDAGQVRLLPGRTATRAQGAKMLMVFSRDVAEK